MEGVEFHTDGARLQSRVDPSFESRCSGRPAVFNMAADGFRPAHIALSLGVHICMLEIVRGNGAWGYARGSLRWCRIIVG